MTLIFGLGVAICRPQEFLVYGLFITNLSYTLTKPHLHRHSQENLETEFNSVQKFLPWPLPESPAMILVPP